MESKLRAYLEEEVTATAEKRNWKRIEPKIDTAITSLSDVERLVGDKFRKHLSKVINSLKAIKTDIRHAK